MSGRPSTQLIPVLLRYLNRRTCTQLGNRQANRSLVSNFRSLSSITSAPSSPSTNDRPCVSLTFHLDCSVAVITLCNPTRRNALSYSMMEQFDQHVHTLDTWSRIGNIDAPDGGKRSTEKNDCDTNDIEQSENNNSRVVIITGMGGNFCSGLDLHASAETIAQPLKEGINMTKHMTRLTNHLHSLPILSISAIDGYAMGGGAELTTCTDLVVLSRDAKIQFVHAKRGASMGWGGGRRLVKKLGRSRALRMLLLGESVLGEEEARRLEFNKENCNNILGAGTGVYADFVADEGETALDATMKRIVHPILQLPCAKSVRAIKSAVSFADGDGDIIDSTYGGLRMDSNMALRGEMDSFVSVWGGDSNKEQIRKAKERLKEKKKPKE